MQLIENLRLALSALAANKMRSLLTMLGIIIGISSVIMITTIGSSIQKTLTNTFNQFGTNYLDVFLSQTNYDSDVLLTEDDYINREMIDELIETYGDRFRPEVSDSFGAAYLQNTNGEELRVALSGTLMDKPTKTHLRGRTISLRDNQEKKHAIYVNDMFVRQYFKDGSDPIGQTVILTLDNGITVDFVIVGIYELPAFYDKEVFSPGTKEIDKITPVWVPIDTILDLTHVEQSVYPYLIVEYNTDYDPEESEQLLRDFFDEKFSENPNIEYDVQNEQTELGLINTVINIVTIAISVIAAISLIVGGVGVMNIMLVSITERTKEIGIRKALGAQNTSIRLQFVTEAILICLIGGVIGIALGIAGGMLIGFIAITLVTEFYSEYSQYIAVTIQPSVSAIIISVVFSMLIGLLFGYYPANKAAKMNPIDALRYD